jgi:hypothetical protein
VLFWKSWIESAEFGLEANGVIILRLLKMTRGGSDGAEECWQMMAEKIAAFTDANAACAFALADGKSVGLAASSALAPIKRRVRTNLARLLSE